MLNELISRLEIEEFPITGGFRCRIFGKPYVEEVHVADLLLERDVYKGTASITDAMFTVGMMLGLHKKGETLDFRLMKDLPKNHPTAKLDPEDRKNFLAIHQAPGRTFFQATGYRKDEAPIAYASSR